jgi:O-antigen/teichoic acid export membrane protein
MSRTFARAVLGLGIVRLLAVAAGFGTAVAGARLLGPSGLGSASVALTTGLIAGVVFNCGINIAAIYLLGRGRDRSHAIVGSLTVMALCAAAVAFFVTTALWHQISDVVTAQPRDYLGPVAGFVAATVILYEFGGAVVLGLGQMQTYTRAELTRATATFALTWILLTTMSASDAAFVSAAAAAYVAAAIVPFIAIRRELDTIPISWNPPIAREALSIGVRGQLGNILQYLNLRVDQLFVPALLQLHAAGIYAIAVRVSEVVAQIASSAASLIFPAVARGTDTDSTVLTERTIRITIVVVAAAAVVLGLLAEPLHVIGFGEEFRGGTATVRLLLVAMVPLTVARILAGDLKGRGRPGLVSAVMAMTLVLTVMFDLLLIPLWGIEGAALASVIAYGASALLLGLAFVQITPASLGRLVPRPADIAALVALARVVVDRRSAAVSVKAQK